MAHVWQGVINEYRDRLPFGDEVKPVTLGEGGTPLIHAPALSAQTGNTVYLKFEGMNPTGSFKDRGMTSAITAAKREGAKAVVCASTGNTSASAAAYALQAGMRCAVLVPDGKISMGKLFSENYPVFLVNSVNPYRIEGQKTGSFEVVDTLGDAPDYHLLPVGNAGNITAYWKGYKEYSEPYTNRDGKVLEPVTTKRPIMWGFQAAGAAPIVAGHPIDTPETIATAIRIGNPASWEKAEAARDESGGVIEAVTDEEILEAHRWLSSREGVFVEPASAAGVAGLLKKHRAGEAPEGKTIVITVTGHGLKDPQWALEPVNGAKVEPTKAAFDVVAVADILDLN